MYHNNISALEQWNSITLVLALSVGILKFYEILRRSYAEKEPTTYFSRHINPVFINTSDRRHDMILIIFIFTIPEVIGSAHSVYYSNVTWVIFINYNL